MEEVEIKITQSHQNIYVYMNLADKIFNNRNTLKKSFSQIRRTIVNKLNLFKLKVLIQLNSRKIFTYI